MIGSCIKPFRNQTIFLVLREITDNVSVLQTLIFWLAFCQVTKSYKKLFLPARIEKLKI